MENVVTSDYSTVLNTINSNLVALSTDIDSLYSVCSLIFYGLVILIALELIKGV